MPLHFSGLNCARAWHIGLIICLMTSQHNRGVAQVAAAKSAPPIRLTNDQQRAMGAAMNEYRNARKDYAKRTAAVDAAIALGAEPTARMLDLVTKDLEPWLRKYRENFTRRAVVMMRDKLKTVKVDEVQTHRNKVLALAKVEGLTKEQIVADADPAMARLEELLLIDRATVLAAATDLQTQREAMQETGALWEKLAVAQHTALPDNADKPSQPPSFAEHLVREEDLAVRLAGPIDDAARQVLAYNTTQEQQMDPEEARCTLELNLMRILLGLNACAFDKKLVAAGRDHSNDMERLNFFEHESPVAGKKTPWDRAKNFGTSASGENIYMGREDGHSAHTAWFHSPGHFKNQLGAGHKRIGVGRHNRHWTQLFGS
jgi:uncharacterized protein YkwD